MTGDIFETVKNNVKIADVVQDYGVQLNYQGQGLCPFHKEKTPSFSVKRDDNIFKCFGCGESGDAISFVAKIKGIEPIEAARELAERYHIEIEEKKTGKPGTITEYLKRCIADIGKTDYFEKRGLNKTTIRKFCLGYDAYHNSAVIPYSSKLTYYQTRSIGEKAFYKPKTEDAGAEPVFNCNALKLRTKEPIFVVESPICAMSVYQSGGNAIATCGTSGWKKVVDEVKKKKPLGGFILCFDNDEPGRKASGSMYAELNALGVQVVEFNIAGDCKDPNELLTTNNKQLEENVAAAKMWLRKQYATSKDSFTASELQDEDVAPPTWIVDKMLPTGLALLCAPSKLGKSWMMLQLCIAVADGKEFLGFNTKKCECLYYALEDSKARLKDRMQKMLKGKRAPSGVHFALDADPIDHGFMEKVVVPEHQTRYHRHIAKGARKTVEQGIDVLNRLPRNGRTQTLCRQKPYHDAVRASLAENGGRERRVQHDKRQYGVDGCSRYRVRYLKEKACRRRCNDEYDRARYRAVVHRGAV